MSDRWPSEPIPDTDLLYMRVHKQYIKPGRISAHCFRNHRDELTGRAGMSTDWNKYATAEECRTRARRPEDNGVIELVVGRVRQIPQQTVEHTPIQGRADVPDNRAHTDVFGPKEEDPEIQVLFSRQSRLVLDHLD